MTSVKSDSRGAAGLDSRARMQQFNLRFLLAMGMLWGGFPFVAQPFMVFGTGSSPLEVVAMAFNSLTVLPACALGFWHRRIMCVWLSVNAAMLIAMLAVSAHTGWHFNGAELADIAGAIVLAVWLDIIELKGWPGALEK